MAEGDLGLEPILAQAIELAIPVIALGEYRYGIALSRDRSRYEKWLGDVLSGFRVLQVDEDTAVEYGHIRSELRRKGRPIPGNDAWIAALARQHAMPILSRDEHFDVVPRLKRVAW
jgi:predicted nucleic acid-binding protein